MMGATALIHQQPGQQSITFSWSNYFNKTTTELAFEYLSEVEILLIFFHISSSYNTLLKGASTRANQSRINQEEFSNGTGSSNPEWGGHREKKADQEQWR